jgi:hypothetical protein
LTKHKLSTKVEKYGLATFVLERVLTGTSVAEVTREINVIAEDQRMDTTFSYKCVANFLKRCGAAHAVYQHDLVKKTLETIIDVVKESAQSIARLVRAAEEAEDKKEIRALTSISRELHNGLRLLAEMQKKLAPPEIHITQVNAIIMDIAGKIEQAEDIPLLHRKSFLRLLAESIPTIGQLSMGAPGAKKALAKKTTDTRNTRGTEG